MARTFNGTNQKLQFAGAPVTTYPFRFGCWFNGTRFASAPALVTLRDNTTSNEFQLFMDGSGHVCLLTVAATGVQGTTRTTIRTGTWGHAFGVCTNATRRAVYLNGGGKATRVTSKSPTGINTTRIGWDPSPTWFPGIIAEVAIWNVALTDADVTTLAGAVPPYAIRPDALVAYFPLIGQYSPEINLARNTAVLTVTGATAGAHPRIAKNVRGA